MHWNRRSANFQKRTSSLHNRKRVVERTLACDGDSFTKTKKLTYDSFVFFLSKQHKEETVESFYGRLIEQTENCSLEDEETTLIRDTFIFNFLEHETQKELPKETVSPKKALEIAIHMDMVAQNQQKVNQNLNTNAQSVNIVNNFQGRNRNTNYQ